VTKICLQLHEADNFLYGGTNICIFVIHFWSLVYTDLGEVENVVHKV